MASITEKSLDNMTNFDTCYISQTLSQFPGITVASTLLLNPLALFALFMLSHNFIAIRGAAKCFMAGEWFLEDYSGLVDW